jgi:hypothetical protein
VLIWVSDFFSITSVKIYVGSYVILIEQKRILEVLVVTGNVSLNPGNVSLNPRCGH